MHSQLHSFTAMAFGKDPTEVTDGEIHSFLRIFVFLPAIFVAFASTLLAVTAVTRVKPKTIEIEDGLLESFIDPYAREVMARAAAQSEARVVEILERHMRRPAGPEPAPVAEPEPPMAEPMPAAEAAATSGRVAEASEPPPFAAAPVADRAPEPAAVDPRRLPMVVEHGPPPLKIVKGE
jgi:hypothetical protein